MTDQPTPAAPPRTDDVHANTLAPAGAVSPSERIALAVRKKIEAAYAWNEEEWSELRPHYETRVAELRPVLESQHLKALEIAVCDKDLLEHAAHAGRLLKLARLQAIREILKPGYAQMAFGGPRYGALDSSRDPAALEVHTVTIDGKVEHLSDHNDADHEAALEAAAIAKLKIMGLGKKGIDTKAFELCLAPLQAIQRQIALIQARREQLLTSYHREAALIGPAGGQ